MVEKRMKGDGCDDASCSLPGVAEGADVVPLAATSGTVLHYIYDPLCGWCYGAAPLLKAAREIDGVAIKLHGGGMMTGSSRRQVSAQLRDYVMQHDHRIAAMTGQVFGDGYFNGLLLDTTAIFDSAPPITAILAAEALAGRALEMLDRIQIAHYVQGLRVADVAVLRGLASDAGLDATAFDGRYAELSGAATAAHIADSRALLNQMGGQGFPTFALQRGGKMEVLDVGHFLGQAAAWKAVLTG
ncbi:Thioredoxin-like protein [Collimonas arenae]|uniref:Thioredoxin-like protein n=1 Tax=Collimonas arenae TaxID=279058 RepID=A0A0A1F7F2_9BURK|nr:DsbA family protein [Collimonas arenae]AIY40451.1 Thioredoxin-like protein [Collimonas arenae]